MSRLGRWRRDEGKGTGCLPVDGRDQLSCITSPPLIKHILEKQLSRLYLFTLMLEDQFTRHSSFRSDVFL